MNAAEISLTTASESLKAEGVCEIPRDRVWRQSSLLEERDCVRANPNFSAVLTNFDCKGCAPTRHDWQLSVHASTVHVHAQYPSEREWIFQAQALACFTEWSMASRPGKASEPKSPASVPPRLVLVHEITISRGNIWYFQISVSLAPKRLVKWTHTQDFLWRTSHARSRVCVCVCIAHLQHTRSLLMTQRASPKATSPESTIFDEKS